MSLPFPSSQGQQGKPKHLAVSEGPPRLDPLQRPHGHPKGAGKLGLGEPHALPHPFDFGGLVHGLHLEAMRQTGAKLEGSPTNDQARRVDGKGELDCLTLPVGMPLAAATVARDVAVDAVVHPVAKLSQDFIAARGEPAIAGRAVEPGIGRRIEGALPSLDVGAEPNLSAAAERDDALGHLVSLQLAVVEVQPLTAVLAVGAALGRLHHVDVRLGELGDARVGADVDRSARLEVSLDPRDLAARLVEAEVAALGHLVVSEHLSVSLSDANHYTHPA